MQALTLHLADAYLVADGVKWTHQTAKRWEYRGDVIITSTMKPHLPTTGAVTDPVWGDASAVVGDHVIWPDKMIHRHTGVETILHGGVAVAVASILDIVPVKAPGDPRPGPHFISDFPHEGELVHQQGGLWLIGSGPPNRGRPTRIEDQRPYGRWAPGSSVILFGNVRRVPLDDRSTRRFDPVRVAGKPKVWTPPADVVDRVLDRIT